MINTKDEITVKKNKKIIEIINDNLIFLFDFIITLLI